MVDEESQPNVCVSVHGEHLEQRSFDTRIQRVFEEMDKDTQYKWKTAIQNNKQQIYERNSYWLRYDHRA